MNWFQDVADEADKWISGVKYAIKLINLTKRCRWIMAGEVEVAANQRQRCHQPAPPSYHKLPSENAGNCRCCRHCCCDLFYANATADKGSWQLTQPLLIAIRFRNVLMTWISNNISVHFNDYRIGDRFGQRVIQMRYVATSC